MTAIRAAGAPAPPRLSSLASTLASLWSPWSLSALLAGGLDLAVTVVFLAYGRSLSVGFLGDDFNILEQLLSDGPFSRWASHGQPFFRPVVVWSYFLELKLWGLDPMPFHLVNLLMHLTAGVGVALLAQQLTARFTTWRRRQRWEVGGAAGLLFLSHPSHVEPVVWVSCLGDLQAAVFSLGCLLCHGRWVAAREGIGEGAAGGGPADGAAAGGLRRWRIGSVVALALALGSKEAAVTVPLVVLVLEGMARRGGFKERLTGSLKAAAPLLAMLPVYLGLRTWVLGTLIGGYGTETHLRMDPVRALDSLFADLSRSLIPMISGRQLPAGAVAVILGLAAVWGLRRGAKAGLVGLGPRRGAFLPGLCLVLFAIAALPTLGMRISQDTTSAERLLYLPSIFALISAAVFLRMAVPEPRYRRWVLAVVCLAFTVQTARAMEPWRQAGKAVATILESLRDEDFEGRTYLVGVPDSIRGAYVLRNGLGSALRLQGQNSGRFVLVHRLMLPRADCAFALGWRKKTAVLAMKDRRCRARFRYRPEMRDVVQEVRSGAFRTHFRLPELSPRDRILLYSAEAVKAVPSAAGRSS